MRKESLVRVAGRLVSAGDRRWAFVPDALPPRLIGHWAS